jgi:pyruvate dehydrogenase E1 component beta subunit
MPWTKLVADAYVPKTGGTGRILTYCQAILEAQAAALEADSKVFVMGEGVDDPSGVFGSTKGLEERFGTMRVFDLPIAENGCQGFAVGAAVTGMRPIVVHMRCDFLFMAMDQIVNHAAKWRTMTGGRQNAPMVIRSIIGRGWGSAAQHSQSPQGVFMSVPGLKVVMPAFPVDAKGLLLSAVADDDPVLIIEHRWLYSREGEVPEDVFFTPIGKGRVVREGSDLTIAALSLMVYEALDAADALKAEGIEAEVVDMRSVKPWDKDLLLASLAKTGRLVLADTGQALAGWSAEAAATVAEEGLHLLKAPIARVCLPDAPTPAAAPLEAAYYPGWKEIFLAAVRCARG